MHTKTAVGLVVGFLGTIAVLSVSVQGCGGGGSTCAVGSVGCACTAGGVCDPGLSCTAGKCAGASNVDGGNVSDTAVATTDPNVACADVANVCAKYNECAPALVKILYGSVENCTVRFKLDCVDAFKAPDSGLTAAAIAACTAALPAASCEDVIYRKVVACSAKGTRTNGGACGTNEQCLSGHCTDNNLACGVCADFVGAGSACAVTDDCSPGLICSDDNHCVNPGTAGNVCNANQPCKYGLYCRNGSCVNGATTAGASCQDLVASCEELKGIYCNTTVGTCANLGFASPGDPCGLVAGKYVVCSAGSCIFASADATDGICAAQAADGAACRDQTSNGEDCQDPAVCVANHCKLPSSAACL